MGVKFRLDYCDASENEARLDIEVKGYGGAIHSISAGANPFVLHYKNENKDKSGYFVTSSADIEIYEDENFTIDSLLTSDETAIKVTHYINQAVHWVGFVVPDFYETSIESPRLIRLSASDRLVTLKEATLEPDSGLVTFKELVQDSLAKTGLSLSLNYVIGFKPDGAASFDFLNEVQTYGQRLFDTQGRQVSCWDIVRSVLVIANAYLMQQGGEWYIINKWEHEQNAADTEIQQVEVGARRKINPPASSVGVMAEYGGGQTYPKNFDFSSITGWTAHNGFNAQIKSKRLFGINPIDGAAIFTEDDDRPFLLNRNDRPTTLAGAAYLESSYIPVISNNTKKAVVKITIAARSSQNTALFSITAHKGATVKAWQEDGSWGGVPASVDDLLTLNIGTSFGFPVSAQKEYEVVLEEPLFGAGDVNDWHLKVRIYGSKAGSTPPAFNDVIYDMVSAVNVNDDVQAKGNLFEIKQGVNFTKAQEIDTTVWGDYVTQGINGYFYAYPDDDLSILHVNDTPAELWVAPGDASAETLLLHSVRQRARMFSKAHNIITATIERLFNPLDLYEMCGDKYVLVSATFDFLRTKTSLVIEQVGVDGGVVKRDYIYSYFGDNEVKSIKGIGSVSSGGGGITPGQGDGRYLKRDSNLWDLTNLEHARLNLSVYSKQEASDRFLKRNSNLWDLTDFGDARSNLSVYSKSESNSRFLQTSNKLSELTDISGAKTFLSSVNIGKSGAGNDADLHVWGNIIQHGEPWEVHVNEVYTKDDFITTRDGAVGALGAGEISGIRALLADGSNNIILGVDNSGLFRVGKENGTLVALAGREDSPTQNGIPYWDGSANNIFKTSGNATLDGAGNAEFHSIEIATTSLLKGLVTTENEIVLGKQASGTTHALRADRTLTLKGDAPISFDTESARNLTANRTWTASLASQDPLFLDAGKLGVKEHGIGQTGTLNTGAQDIYGAKTFKDDTLFEGTLGTPSNLWGITPAGVAHFDEFTARALMVEDFKANTNLVFSGKHTLTKSVGILERAWRVPLSENFVDSVINWTPISYTNWGGNISGYIPVIAGQKYYFSAEIRNLVGAEVRVRLQTLDSSQNIVRDNINANYIQDNGVTSSTAVIADGEAYIRLVWRKIDGSSQTSYEYRNLLVVLGDSTPQSLYISAPEGWMEGQVFEDGDFVRVPVVNRAAGLRLGDAWGNVQRVENLEGNLLYNSTFNRGADGWSNDVYFDVLPPESDKPRSAVFRTEMGNPAGSQEIRGRAVFLNASPSTKITFTLDFKYDDFEKIDSGATLFQLRRADEEDGTFVLIRSINQTHVSLPDDKAGEWFRIHYTETLGEVFGNPGWFSFSFFASSYQSSATLQIREIDVYLGDYDPDREYQPQGAIQKYEFTPRRIDDSVKGLTAGAGTTAMSVGSADNPVAMITDDVISQDAPFTSITSWEEVPWDTGSNITDIIRTGNLAGLNNPNVVGDGIFGRNAYFTGKLLVGDLSKTNNYMEYDSEANSGLGALKIKTNAFDLTAGNGDHWKTADNSFQFGGANGISFAGGVNDKIIHGSNSLFKGLVEIGSGNNIFKADGDLGIWLGHANMASAPFSVTRAGVLKATSGSIGGADIGNYGLKYTTGVLAAYVGDATSITNGNISGGLSDTGFVIGKANNYIGMATDPYGDNYVMKALISGNEVFRLGSVGNRIAGAYFDNKGMWAGGASKANARMLLNFDESKIQTLDGSGNLIGSFSGSRVELLGSGGYSEVVFYRDRSAPFYFNKRIGSIDARFGPDQGSLLTLYSSPYSPPAGGGAIPGEVRVDSSRFRVIIENTAGGGFLIEGLPTSDPLEAGKLYTRTAAQLGGSGSDRVLCVSQVTINPPASAPLGLRASKGAGSFDPVSIEWNPVTAQGTVRYKVFRDSILVTTTAGTQFLDFTPNQNPNTKYTYYVRAINEAGEGPNSSPLYVTYNLL